MLMKKLLLLFLTLVILSGCSAAREIYHDDLGAVVDSHVLGDVTAPVQIVEYTDFECNFCANFHNDTFRKIKTNYISTGKASFVIIDFPLISVHKNAFDAAKASYCAGDQDRYWEMLDKIFGNQGNLRIKNLIEYAEQIEVKNMVRFEDCLRSDKYDKVIERNLVKGANAGVKGPPTFFINDVQIDGAQSFELFAEKIDKIVNQ